MKSPTHPESKGSDLQTDAQEAKSPLSEGERMILAHISRWGSDGYPVRKLGKRAHWIWDEMYGVKGAPVVYKTKRAAITAFENYLGVLRDKLAGR